MGSCVEDHSKAAPNRADCVVDSVSEGDDCGIAIEGRGACNTVTEEVSIAGRVPAAFSGVGGVFRFRHPGLGPGFPACEGYTHCRPNLAQASQSGVTRLPVLKSAK